MASDDRPTAQRFIERLGAIATDAERTKLQRYFKSGEGEYGEGDEFIGVRMGSVFALADEFRSMPLDEPLRRGWFVGHHRRELVRVCGR